MKKLLINCIVIALLTSCGWNSTNSKKEETQQQTKNTDYSWVNGIWKGRFYDNVTERYISLLIAIDMEGSNESGTISQIDEYGTTTGIFTLDGDGILRVKFPGEQCVATYELDVDRHRIGIGEDCWLTKSN